MKGRIFIRNILLSIGMLAFLSFAIDKEGYMGNGKLYTVNFDTLKTGNSFNYSNLFNSVEIVELDNQALIGNIGKMDLYKDKLIVLDNRLANGVFVFDKKGKFIRKIGSIGSGPKEFAACTDFAIDRQAGIIYIYDWNSKKINLYDIDTGEYKNTLKLDNGAEIHKIWCNGGVLYAANTFFYLRNSEGKDYILRRLDRNNGCEVARWMDVEQYNKGWRDAFISSSLFYHAKGGKDLFAYGFSDTIMCISNGKVTPYLALSGQKVVKTSDISAEEKEGVLDAKKRAEMHIRLGNRLDKITGVSNMFEHGDNLYFNYTTWHLYMAICNKETGAFSSYLYFKDDVFFTPQLENHTLPTFLTSDDGGVYYGIGTDYLSEMKRHFEEGYISEKVKNRKVLESITEDSNPVILYYEYRNSGN